MAIAFSPIPKTAKIIVDTVVEANSPWSAIIRRGQHLRLIDSHGQQAVDTLFYNAADFSERYSGQDTVRTQGSLYIGKGTCLISNNGNVLLHVIEDTCGSHDTCAGACSCESNTVRFGHHTRYFHACRENFLVEGAKYGLSKRDIVPNLNFFMNVPIDSDGKCTVVDGVSKPGDYVEMRAEIDVLCLVSNCPQVLNPCNGFFPTPIRIVVFE